MTLSELTPNEIDGMRSMKFGTFEPGDMIKGYGFEPMPGRPERYLQGTITRFVRHPFTQAFMYEIEIEENAENPNDDSRYGFIPVGVVGEDSWAVDRVQAVDDIPTNG